MPPSAIGEKRRGFGKSVDPEELPSPLRSEPTEYRRLFRQAGASVLAALEYGALPSTAEAVGFPASGPVSVMWQDGEQATRCHGVHGRRRRRAGR